MLTIGDLDKFKVFGVPRASGTVHGCMPTWRRAYDRTLQLISDQT